MFSSIKNFHQPNESTCENVSQNASSPVTIGTCDFNYYSHALGLGARYKTPVGPIRVDFSYNLNPPHYPVITEETGFNTYVNGIQPYVGQASHFNFFFSIGQSF
jgi:outer membrane protein assembly factor BamA